MSSAATTTIKNPKTGAIISQHQNTNLSQMPLIFKKARQAQRQWLQKSFSQRRNHILKMKQFIRENRDAIVKVITDCNGKTKVDALATEVLPALMAIDWYADNAESVLKERRVPIGNILFANKRSYETYVPLGVVGIVSPWNYSLGISFQEILMGLMAGNAIIFKIASTCVPVGIMIEKIVACANLPEGLFQHVVLSGSQIPKAFFSTEHRDARVDKLFFTGSVPVGKSLMRDASETLTPLSLELGGNDAAIVMQDACLERAAQGIIWAGLQNTGQSCGGVERVYVHADVFDKFVALLTKYVNAMRHGDDDVYPDEVTMGSLSTEKQLKTVQEHLQDALDKGARILAQSKPVGDVSKGFFHPAVLLDNVTEDMLLMKEETFGPLLPVLPFTDVEDAIRATNDSDLGLTASVWSNGRQRHKIARRLQAGVVVCNDHLYTHGRSELAWRGFKHSGIGSTHGVEGLREMCQLRTIDDELMPFIRRNIWYYPHGTATYAGLCLVLQFLNPSNVFQKISALLRMIPFALRMFTNWNPEESASETKKEK